MRTFAASLATVATANMDGTQFKNPAVAGFSSAVLGHNVLLKSGDTFNCIMDVLMMGLELEMAIEDFLMDEYILIADGVKLLGFFMLDLSDALIQCADSTRATEVEDLVILGEIMMESGAYGIIPEA